MKPNRRQTPLAVPGVAVRAENSRLNVWRRNPDAAGADIHVDGVKRHAEHGISFAHIESVEDTPPIGKPRADVGWRMRRLARKAARFCKEVVDHPTPYALH